MENTKLDKDWAINHYIECDCGDNNHLFKFSYHPSDDYDIGSLSLSVQLNQYHSWYERVWLAIKYVFGYTSNFGHWDCTLMDSRSVEKLSKFIEQCVGEIKKDRRYNLTKHD
jgi:hypothetical protein